ncbi:MAG: hypothetical protein KA318_00110 [Nitrosomonas sp.]|nr:hypothetical protein [Nitrosomonas sp.]
MIKDICGRKIICDDAHYFPHVSIALDVVGMASREDMHGCTFQQIKQMTMSPEVVKMICEKFPSILDEIVGYQKRWTDKIK